LCWHLAGSTILVWLNKSNLPLFLRSHRQRPKQTNSSPTLFCSHCHTNADLNTLRQGGDLFWSSKTRPSLSSDESQISRSRPRAIQPPICNLIEDTFRPFTQQQQTTSAKISLPRLYRMSQTISPCATYTLEAISDFLYGAQRVLDLLPGWSATLASNGSCIPLLSLTLSLGSCLALR
jgi:hypothetical protein